MLIVHNHQPRVIDIPGPQRKTPGSDGTVVSDFHIKLRPGANEVKPEHWAEVEKYEVIKHLIAMGQKGLEVKKLAANEFDKLPVDEALRLASETLDRAQLRKWAESETRGKVKSALEKQIKKVTVDKTAEE